MEIPNTQDFDPFGSLDEATAREQFLGKSFVEAIEMFADNTLLYGESLSHMGERAALFYGAALLHYVNSEASHSDVGAASAVVAATESWLESRFDLGPIEPELCRALHRIHEQFSFYAPDRLAQGIYHQLPEAANGVLRRLNHRVRA